jgi:TolB-like protein
MSRPKRSLPHILAELKRRRVPRSLLVYFASGFAILEAADILIPTLGFPAWVLQVVVVVLVLGIPVTVVVSWAYDLTSRGFVTTPGRSGPPPEPSDNRSLGAPNQTGWFSPGSIVLIVFFVLVGVAGGWFLEPLVRGKDRGASRGSTPGDTRPSIAILPFENLTSSEEIRFFADGIHEEVLTSLSKVPDLKVIPRISVLEYLAGAQDVESIAAELGVDNLGTGTVQQAGDRVRVGVHLIDVGTGEELWGDTYERTLSDVFAIQASIARNVAHSLVTTLSPQVETLLSAGLQADSLAYLLYVRGTESLTRGVHSLNPPDMEDAVRSLAAALERDSTFVLARASLSVALEWSARAAAEPERKAEFLRRASQEAAEALRVAPEMPEALFAMAFQGSQSPGTELRTQEDIGYLRRAEEELPNGATVLRELAVRFFRLGRMEDAAEYSRRAVELAPRSALYQFLAGEYARFLRDFDTSLNHLRTAATLLTSAFPEASNTIFRSISLVHIANGGGVEALRRVLAEERGLGLITGRGLRDRLEDFPELLDGGEFEELVGGLSPEASDTEARCTCYGLKAWNHQVAGRAAEARVYWDSLAAEIQGSPGSSPHEWEEPLRLVGLGLAVARAGRTGEARELLEGIALPSTRSPVEWDYRHLLAQAYAELGEAESAVEELTILLRAPTGMTEENLRTRLFWEPIRTHPAFQALLK